MADGGIHSLGNGRMCVYERGPDIIQIFGPPYSAPDLGSLIVEPGDAASSRSSREPGAAIWTHTLPGAVITDFVDADLPCLARRVRVSAGALRLRLQINPTARVVRLADEAQTGLKGLLCEIPAGSFFYSRYPYPRPVFYQAAWKGTVDVTADAHPSGENWFDFLCGPGESWLYIAGGPEYPQAVSHMEAALAQPGEALLARTRSAWQSFTACRTDWPARLPAAAPQRDRLLQAVDDVAVLIKSQQAGEGGVLAGHNYHLCYVRDQYGVSRGLLAIGHLTEARAILEFYWNVWQRSGRIHNAQAAGVEGVFHIHENDDVEITGYLIQQAFELQDATGDDEFTRQILPMLEWAYAAQKQHLVLHMLPFNGDETYVAGGILPRSALNDGSAEATLLFIESGERLLAWANQRGVWTQDKITAERQLLADTRANYRANFMTGGQLATNNPDRAAVPGGTARFRHGVCERCAAEGRFEAIGWTERSVAGRYLCPRCLSQGSYLPVEPRRYILQSVSLTPLYFRSQFLAREEMRPTVEALLDAYRRTGRLPSRPEGEIGVTVGYDYGFLLYALTEYGHPGARELYEKTLSLTDSTGAWVEYYRDHQPSGTRCRPWESAINVEALLHWANRGGIGEEEAVHE